MKKTIIALISCAFFSTVLLGAATASKHEYGERYENERYERDHDRHERGEKYERNHDRRYTYSDDDRYERRERHDDDDRYERGERNEYKGYDHDRYERGERYEHHD